MVRDPWDMKELAACAAAVKKAAGPGQDTLVLVPGMGESTSTLVSVLDALVASFPHVRIVPDGDILRGRSAKEELARRDAQQRKKK